MLSQFNSYFKNHPDHWQYLVNNPNELEKLILQPESFELFKVQYREKRNEQLVHKLRSMSMLLRMMEMTNG